MKKLLRLSVFIFVTTIYSASFAQETKKISPMIPALSFQSDQGLDLARVIEGARAEIEHNEYYMEYLQSYANLRDGRASGRGKLDSFPLNLRYIAEKRCDEISDKDLKDICSALKNNNCSALTGRAIDFCNALQNENATLLYNTLKDKKFCNAFLGTGEMQLADAKCMMGLYVGFKYYSRTACERFINDCPFPQHVACGIIFGAQGSKEALSGLVNDMAILEVAKKTNKRDLCIDVNDPKLKEYCESKGIKSLKDVWFKY